MVAMLAEIHAIQREVQYRQERLWKNEISWLSSAAIFFLTYFGGTRRIVSRKLSLLVIRVFRK